MSVWELIRGRTPWKHTNIQERTTAGTHSILLHVYLVSAFSFNWIRPSSEILHNEFAESSLEDT